MITELHHIAIIVSSEVSISFYEALGFSVISLNDRGHDKLCFMEGNGITLELFIDPQHPKRVDRPEAMGLRHLAFTVDDLEKTVASLPFPSEPIRIADGKKYTFIKDPDGLPIELHE